MAIAATLVASACAMEASCSAAFAQGTNDPASAANTTSRDAKSNASPANATARDTKSNAGLANSAPRDVKGNAGLANSVPRNMKGKPGFAAKTNRATTEKPVSIDPKAGARTSPSPYLQRVAVLAYIDDLVANRQFDRAALMRIFGDARYSDTVARLMSPAASTGKRRDWQVYRARFVEPLRLAAGLQFWDDNAAWLDQAERDYGVPPEIVVGILGCETIYGRNTGSFRVIDTLATLAFDYPNKQRDRSSFFREQLTDALTMDRDGIVDLTSLRGSFAGAIGMPQFMPGSIQSYAVDYDHDGRIDLARSAADVIGSVANFLAQQGWVRGLPTHVELTASANADASRIAAMVEAGSVPSYDFGELADAGFVPSSPPPVGKFALIDLPSGVDARGNPQTAYLAGTENFHVVTRYNRSYFYALSVIELGATIRALRDARNTLPQLLPQTQTQTQTQPQN